MTYVLFNPLANKNACEQNTRQMLEGKIDADAEFKDITKLDIKEFITGLNETDRVILAGGDGTINKFVNALGGEVPSVRIEYIPTGSGNDFKKDVATDDGFIDLNKYIANLPTVTVNGESFRFINGIGFGIDGYCCEVGDDLKSKSDKPVNYAGIAVKGLLFHFKPRNATVIVDGVEHTFEKVWLAPTMKGRYYGGGMMVAPDQDRFDAEGKLTAVVWHGTGKLTTPMRFPKIFKGEHTKYDKMISIFTGKEITVRFDKPTALQIDGETVRGVTEYTVKA